MTTPVQLGQLTRLLQTQFPQAITGFHSYRGDETVSLDRRFIVKVCEFLRDDSRCQFNLMVDLTAVDYIKERPRFEVVYHLKSLSLGHRLRLKVRVPEEDCALDSVHHVWKVVNWYERECFDMYGIRFHHHPNLTRLLMYEQFQGHPLRKDYPISQQQPIVPLRPVEERYDYGSES